MNIIGHQIDTAVKAHNFLNQSELPTLGQNFQNSPADKFEFLFNLVGSVIKKMLTSSLKVTAPRKQPTNLGLQVAVSPAETLATKLKRGREKKGLGAR